MSPVFRRPSAGQPTAQERETRIEELRQRRRARLRWLGARAGIAAALLALLLAVLVYWLLMTFGGRDFLLGQVVARLPAGTSLEWERAEGPASGPLTLHGLRYVQQSCPDRDGEPVAFGDCADPGTLSFTARRATIDPDIRPLLGRLLRLDVLVVEDAVLTLPPSDDSEPFQLPSWPDSLPQIGPLPLGMQADAIQVDGLRVVGADGPLIDIRSVRGGLDARNGRLHLEQVVVDSDRGLFTAHGDYVPSDDYRMDLVASAALPAPAGRTRPRLGLVARGDVSHLDVVVSGSVPGPLLATVALRGHDNPGWRLQADAQALDPSLLAGGEPGIPLVLKLEAEGEGGHARLRGRFERDGLVARLLPSEVTLRGQELELHPLLLEVMGGYVGMRGHADFSAPEDPGVRLSIGARGLRWSGPEAEDGTAADPVHADLALGLAGRQSAWAVHGRGDVARAGQQARIKLDGRGDQSRMRIHELLASMPEGRLSGTGMVAWAPALAWTLDAALEGFDPGYFLPGWDGAVHGQLSTRGETRDDGGLELEAAVRDLGGRLRGRALAGQGHFSMHGAATPAPGQPAEASDYEGELSLSLGESRVQASAHIADSIDVDATLSPLQLQDLLPDARGRLAGRVQLQGPRDAPSIRADLEGGNLAWGEQTAGSLRLHANLPWQGSGGTLDLQAGDLVAGVQIDRLSLQGSGAVEALQLTAAARSPTGDLDLQGGVSRSGEAWQANLAALQITPHDSATWRLQAPARLSLPGDGWQLSEACLAGSQGGTLCVQADWPRSGLTARGSSVPLALAQPWIPARSDGRRWHLDGDINLDAAIRPAGNGFAGHATVDSARGGLRWSERVRRDVIGYSNLRLEADLAANGISATLAAGIEPGGSVNARLQTGWDDYAPLAGTLAVELSELGWLELFSPDIVEPHGHLSANVSLGGTRAAPQISGQARLADFGTELPPLAIVLEDGNVALDALSDGSARITGSVRSGEGTLDIDGRLGWSGEAAAQPLELRLSGSNLLVSDTRDLHAIADPDLLVRYGAGKPLEVTGTVTVPEARIDLERLDSGVSASPDVVVLDPVDTEDESSTAMQMDLTLVMGESVVLNGFGLEGTLGGRLRVRQYPGREMLGSGALQVGGRYKAYGQELQIARGDLSWGNDPIADPVLDIRATRRIDAEDLTAGIDVTGRASSPQARVWTDPERDQSEALAYLALGRPLSSVTGNEGRQLDAASAALSAGGGLLAGQLGASIGLDDAGVSHSRALGGSVLGVGKQLSPRLYVGFGVSLLGTGQVLTLKYLISRGFDLEIESSTLENRGSVNWRRERD